MDQPQISGIIRCGVFELEPATGILRKHGVRVRLQEQPFRLLLALIEKRGEVVTREELRQQVWSGAAFGDFDHSLNIAINKIRDALGDSADRPRFVETLPRRGYRFIAPVEGLPTSVVAPAAAPEPVRIRWRLWAIAGAFTTVILLAALVIWMRPSPRPRLEWRRLTNDASAKLGPVLSDGARLYFQTGTLAGDAGLNLLQVSITGGEPARLPATVPPSPAYRVLDITPDGRELLIALLRHSKLRGDASIDASIQDEGPLWSLRIVEGSTERVGNIVCREARYSPDGERIVFTSGETLFGNRSPVSLWVASRDGANAHRILELKDVDIVVPSWSRGGERITFGEFDHSTQHQAAWEIGANGDGLHRLIPNFSRNHLPAGWTADGSLLVISSGQFWIASPPRLFQFKQPVAIQLSTGDPVFAVPSRILRGGTFYTIGTTPLGELQRFDTGQKRWQPHLGGMSADSAEYSRDGKRVLYTAHPQRELWVRHSDGSHPVKLTKALMQVSGGRWSPDGRMIAFSARSTSDQPWLIHIVDSSGGAPHPACQKQEDCIGLDLSWMPDGRKIVFAAPVGIFATRAPDLRLIDVVTGSVTKFPGSDGLHSPRLSPDGTVLAALVLGGGGEIALYRFSEKFWTKLPQPGPGYPAWPCWSRDSQSIWYYNPAREEIMRVQVRDNRHDVITPLRVEEMTGLIGSYFYLTPDDEPMILRRRDIRQIYALDLNSR